MGDHRLYVEMTLVGADGKKHERVIWVNWHEDRPKLVLGALMDLAEEAQMPFSWPEYPEDRQCYNCRAMLGVLSLCPHCGAVN